MLVRFEIYADFVGKSLQSKVSAKLFDTHGKIFHAFSNLRLTRPPICDKVPAVNA
jgi:hypothetical protein